MQITIDHLTAGAARAEGIAVIIDVCRAYSLECFAFDRGAACIYPIAGLEEAYAMKRSHPDYLLAGERRGRMAPGFDFGNSPAQLEHARLEGRTLIHTTSAGTQGIAAARRARRILAAALVNAAATARYIRQLGADRVSLVCMGFENLRPTEEDTVCAEYIRALLEGAPYDVAAAVPRLREGPGRRFFIPEDQSFAPERDFALCTQTDRFPFALEMRTDASGRRRTVRVDPQRADPE